MPSQNHIHCWVPNLFEFKGGIQVYLQDMLSVLCKELPNHRIHVFDKLDKTTPSFTHYGQNWSFSYSGTVPRFLQTAYFTLSLFLGTLLNRPRLILCCHINFSLPLLLVHRLFGIPYWVFTYGVDVWNVQDQYKIQALVEADKIITIGTYTRDRLLKEQFIPPDQISLLPVTFDASRFSIADKPAYLLERYNLMPNQPIILTVSRLAGVNRAKGYDQILHALPKIRQQLPHVHYILVGKGDDRPRIERLISDLKLHDCVTLAGFVPDGELRDHYNLCDVFAMPSKGEGFGIVYLEALACGKPTLGGNQDGAVDALCQGKLGALVNPDSVTEIANTLLEILEDRYSNSLIYRPDDLRESVINTFGPEAFQSTLRQLINDSSMGESK